MAYSCFSDMAGERAGGMAPGAIPWRAVRAWADDHGITLPDDFDDLHLVVKHLDGLWLKATLASLKRSTKK